ncbi:MAG: hypothetical protein QE280_15085 [Caulobacter sp.]|nr:hypothetical protein [Caulobacter sp.]
MRLLLHVGHAKTGTSSIQGSLAAARGPLLEAGVLYPMPPSFLPNSTNHNSLATGFGSEDRLLRGLKNKIQGSTLTTAGIFKSYCQEIISQIERSNPHITIISGEALFKILDIPESEPFVNFIKLLSSDISVSIYTRRPSDYYLSSMQQKLKASQFIRTPRPLRIRDRIESFQRVFGKSVSLRLYDRDQLKNNDVVSDFLQHNLPEVANKEDLVPTLHSNEGISAEGMSVLQSFRQYNFSESEGVFNKHTNLLIETIRNISINNNLATRAKLINEIRDFVDYSTVDLIWIRDEFGIEIPNIDYRKISPKRRGPPIEGIRVNDICQVNNLELAKLNTLLFSTAIGLTISSKGKLSAKKVARKNAGTSFLNSAI